MVSVIAGVNLSFLFLNAGNCALNTADKGDGEKTLKKAICFPLKAFFNSYITNIFSNAIMRIVKMWQLIAYYLLWFIKTLDQSPLMDFVKC